jgi:hypothetical protein
MDFDSSDNSDAAFSGKIKTQPFKQFQLERLIKDGKVIPASKLAKIKANEYSASRTLKKRLWWKSVTALLASEKHQQI